LQPLAEESAGAVTPPETVCAVFVAGFMGAGKTTVGRLLAERWGWEFLDLDERITARTGKSPAAIFANAGEEGFRRNESEALRQLVPEISPLSPKVIALGGGTLAISSNLEILQKVNAFLIVLDAPVRELYLRCAQQDVERPLLGTEEEFSERFRRRQSSYRAATHTVNTSGKSPHGVADEIVRLLSDSPAEAT
jgi:shikimate kinase